MQCCMITSLRSDEIPSVEAGQIAKDGVVIVTVLLYYVKSTFATYLCEMNAVNAWDISTKDASWQNLVDFWISFFLHPKREFLGCQCLWRFWERFNASRGEIEKRDIIIKNVFIVLIRYKGNIIVICKKPNEESLSFSM